MLRPYCTHLISRQDPRTRGGTSRSITAVFIAGVVGGLVVVAFVPWARALVVRPVATSWTGLGVMATLSGIIATLFGVGLAFIVAYQWLGFDRRVEEKLHIELQNFKRQVDVGLHQHLQSISELSMALTGTMMLEDREKRVLHLLERTPDIPNASALVAQMFLNCRNDDPAEDQQLQNEWREKSLYWANRAIHDAGYHDPGLPEWVKSQAFAWCHEPHSCLELLSKALSARAITPTQLINDTWLWPNFIGMTRGISQIRQLDGFLSLVNIRRPTKEEFADYFTADAKALDTHFWAVRKVNGLPERVTVRKERDDNDRTKFLWGVLGRKAVMLQRMSLSDCIEHCWNDWIPIRTDA